MTSQYRTSHDLTLLSVQLPCPGQRPLYRHFYPLMDAVLFMVDSADGERLETAGDEFRRLAEEDELQAVPLAVLANKQDLPAVASLPTVADALGLEQARRHRCKSALCLLCRQNVTGVESPIYMCLLC